MESAITVEKLSKTFVRGWRRERVAAVRELSFTVAPGEVFGLVGPNGAGKSTTLRVLLGLVRATAGRCTLLGGAVSDPRTRAAVGYLPERVHLPDHVSATELVTLMARLAGVTARDRRTRVTELLARVGLAGAGARPLRHFSKGMLQRVGLAQALIGDPRLVILDEPMSGLDPVARHELRALIASLRAEGRTVLLSTHILSDIEQLCDRCAIVAGGTLRALGTLEELVSGPPSTAITLERSGERVVEIVSEIDITAHLTRAISEGARVVSVIPQRATLEQTFLRVVARS
jgi:ABC-2 type transport system ATP-binding protein